MSEVHDIRKGVKGRKDYECSLCNNDIPKGELSVVLDTYDGEYGHDRVCSFCGEYVQIGDTFNPDDEDYLPECRPVPDGCLRVDEGEILERA